jgi:hypothetical protein
MGNLQGEGLVSQSGHRTPHNPLVNVPIALKMQQNMAAAESGLVTVSRLVLLQPAGGVVVVSQSQM